MLSVKECEMIGLREFQMDADMYEEFMRVLSNKNSKREPRSQTYHASDHFGVMTVFTV